MAGSTRKKKKKGVRSGKLRIADHWNAISIIANSQANPLKAVAEFVENSIDARAKQIVIVRGKKKGAFYLKISDDGEGIPRDEQGLPDFRRVATHICDSIKRQFKSERAKGIQGEFGIGLLSFWTVGQNLSMTCCGADGNPYQMTMAKDSPDFAVAKKRILLPFKGTDLMIYPLLTGLRSLTGEKIQRYLASELRDRIKETEVTVKVVDRTGRKEFVVVPRQFTGRLLHDLKPAETAQGDIYLEIYLNDPGSVNRVGLYRRGTRVLPSITELDHFEKEPWTAGYLQGIVDAPFLSLTPGTRHGVIRDDHFGALCRAMVPVENHLQNIIQEQRKAEEERSSRQVLRRVQRALKEAFLRLPQEEYDWFDIYGEKPKSKTGSLFSSGAMRGDSRENENPEDEEELLDNDSSQKQFFEYAGPLFSALISPKSSIVAVDRRKKYRVICRDRSRRIVLENLEYQWNITDGEGHLDENHRESITFIAPPEPCLTTLEVIVRQGDNTSRDEALITVTDSLMDQSSTTGKANKGLPGYTYRRAPGEIWRSRYDEEKNVIVINNGHRDFVYAGKQKARKLRYICRLFCKELVRHNFPGLQTDELLERMIELSLYTEEHLK
ncbi:MAG: ATP-binding protein [Desulfobacteraceae bacterium]|nr:ATP-binding protein [Desulfobacteraceae bacterium]